jgi:hypothetical protein
MTLTLYHTTVSGSIIDQNIAGKYIQDNESNIQLGEHLGLVTPRSVIPGHEGPSANDIEFLEFVNDCEDWIDQSLLQHESISLGHTADLARNGGALEVVHPPFAPAFVSPKTMSPPPFSAQIRITRIGVCGQYAIGSYNGVSNVWIPLRDLGLRPARVNMVERAITDDYPPFDVSNVLIPLIDTKRSTHKTSWSCEYDTVRQGEIRFVDLEFKPSGKNMWRVVKMHDRLVAEACRVQELETVFKGSLNHGGILIEKSYVYDIPLHPSLIGQVIGRGGSNIGYLVNGWDAELAINHWRENVNDVLTDEQWCKLHNTSGGMCSPMVYHECDCTKVDIKPHPTLPNYSQVSVFIKGNGTENLQTKRGDKVVDDLVSFITS